LPLRIAARQPRIAPFWFAGLGFLATLLWVIAVRKMLGETMATAGSVPVGASDHERGQYRGAIFAASMGTLALPVIFWLLAVASCVERNLMGVALALAALLLMV
jgi:hypothetical protein